MDSKKEHALRAVKNDRPGQGMKLLNSNGVGEDTEAAWAFLQTVHFEKM